MESSLPSQPPQPPQTSQTSQAPARVSTVQFSGQPMEYFKLWFVNVFLSIVTFGIYSAWAKVRNTQYLYGHTQVDGHRLRYLATPMQILRGRIIALICFVLYSVLSNLNPAAALVLMLVFLIAMPWLVIQGLKFTLRMTAYRNVRFSFEGSYWGVVVNFILLPIVALFTLYLAMPWVIKRVDQFIHSNISYGGKRFSVATQTGQYYHSRAGQHGRIGYCGNSRDWCGIRIFFGGNRRFISVTGGGCG